MPRLINADEVYNEMAKLKAFGELTAKKALRCIENAPTVEAEPVRNAHWIWKGDEGYSRFMCSECGKTATVPTCMGKPDIWEYCPHCGAKMDGEEE